MEISAGPPTRRMSSQIKIHIYFNIEKFAEGDTNFDHKLMAMRKEIMSGKRVPKHERFYKQYFEIKKNPIRYICGTYMFVLSQKTHLRSRPLSKTIRFSLFWINLIS